MTQSVFLKAGRSWNVLGQSAVTCHLKLLHKLSLTKMANIMCAFISFSSGLVCSC